MTDSADKRPCAERRFPLELSREFLRLYQGYLHWLRHLAERLGAEAAESVWREAVSRADHGGIVKTLAGEWTRSDASDNVSEDKLAALADRFFGSPVDGVTINVARSLVETTPPIPEIRQRFDSLNMTCEITTYDGLLLFWEGLALLAERLVKQYGRGGEYIVYDILLDEIKQAGLEQLSVGDFIRQRRERFSRPRLVADMHSAGLEVELISSSATEIVTHVTHCEWARFFRERHPEVGYLMACSGDNAAYRAINPNLRLCRTMTLMEGGRMCDFRIYSVP